MMIAAVFFTPPPLMLLRFFAIFLYFEQSDMRVLMLICALYVSIFISITMLYLITLHLRLIFLSFQPVFFLLSLL